MIEYSDTKMQVGSPAAETRSPDTDFGNTREWKSMNIAVCAETCRVMSNKTQFIELCNMWARLHQQLD